MEWTDNGSTLATRLWSKALADGTGCWIWQRHRDRDGYGKISQRLAHRVAYELVKGPIPEGLTIDHLCRIRACINPDHLEAVTQRDNVLRGIGHPAVNARKTHCVRGHEFTDENTVRYGTRRKCLACRRIN